MKKIFLSATIVFAFSFFAKAQTFDKHAIGLRIGSNDGFGTEVSYQLGLSQTNRLEIDGGFLSNKYYGESVNIYRVSGIYQWVWEIENNFSWYAGAGAGILRWNIDVNVNQQNFSDSGTNIFVVGQVGIQYKIEEAPILLSLDFRPEFLDVGYRRSSLGTDFAFSVRYTF